MRRRPEILYDEPTINLTPLIDVVFVVLIMFIIIAPILEKDRINLAKSGYHEPLQKVDAASLITIQVNAQNQIFINKKAIAPDLLQSTLLRLKQLHPAAIAQVFYDKKAYFENFEKIKSALENTGFSDMDLVLEPSS